MIFKEKLRFYYLELTIKYHLLKAKLSSYRYKYIKLRFENWFTGYILGLITPYISAHIKYSLYEGLNSRLKILEDENDNKKEYLYIKYDTTITNRFFGFYKIKELKKNIIKDTFKFSNKVDFEVYDSPQNLMYFIIVNKDYKCTFKDLLYLLGAVRITDKKMIKYIQENYENTPSKKDME